MVRHLILPLALVALAGCSSGEVKIGVDVAPIKAATITDSAGTENGTSSGTSAESGLELTRVRLLVAHAKIGYTGGDAEADVGPIVVDLTAEEIANGAHREFSLGTLATGTYGGAEIEIEPLDADADTSDADFTDFKRTGASLLVDGTYQGNSFQFAGHFLAEQGTDGEVTVDAREPVALAMSVDPSTWFLDSAGAPLDPADTAQHDALAVAICKTLDTQPQQATPTGTKPAHEGKHGGGRGGGHGEHCVESQ